MYTRLHFVMCNAMTLTLHLIIFEARGAREKDDTSTHNLYTNGCDVYKTDEEILVAKKKHARLEQYVAQLMMFRVVASRMIFHCQDNTKIFELVKTSPSKLRTPTFHSAVAASVIADSVIHQDCLLFFSLCKACGCGCTTFPSR